MRSPKPTGRRARACKLLLLAPLTVAFAGALLALAPMPPGGNSGSVSPANPNPEQGCFTTQGCGPWGVTVPEGDTFEAFTCQSINLSAIDASTTPGSDDNGQLCGSYSYVTTYNGVPVTQVVFCGFDQPGGSCG